MHQSKLLRVGAFHQSQHRTTRGIALVVVLSMLVLVTGLVVAFMQSVSFESRAARSYQQGISTRILADTSVSLVIAQLQEAASQPNEAWVSQPGLIRTFDDAGDPLRSYKLYSADQMVVDGSIDPSSGDEVPADWKTNPDLFTDLNAPGTQSDSSASLVFPVVDGNHLRVLAVEGAQVLTYDAEGDGNPDVEGFWIENPPGFDISGPPGPENNPLPMPLKWLYQLKDGRMATASPAQGGGVELSPLSGPPITADNPPVARIAFWTDDESTKVNINTASEGTFWDTPVGNSFDIDLLGSSTYQSIRERPLEWEDQSFEFDLAAFQPARNEFQRYGGHPATTSLSPLLAQALRDGNPESANNPVLLNEILFELLPRYHGGPESSLSGTRQPGRTALGTYNNDARVPVATDRLFASVDELLFRPDRTEAPLGRPEERRQLLERLRFFATAHSRAPEVNLFNKPRIATWPIHADSNKRTALDDLFAFCGTLPGAGGDEAFYFTRAEPLSTTADFTPGSRNDLLYGYLQRQSGLDIPGFGGSFLTKFGSDRDQILTQVFDYIRILNLADPTRSPDTNEPFFASYTEANNTTFRGLVAPIVPQPETNASGTRGFGRLPIISEVAVVIQNLPRPDKDFPGNTYSPDPNSTALQVALVVELAGLGAGFSSQGNGVRLVWEDLENFKVNGQSVIGKKYIPDDVNIPPPYPERTDESQHASFVRFDVHAGFRHSRIGGIMGIIPVLSFDRRAVDPQWSSTPIGDIEVPVAAGQEITVNGGKIRVRIEGPFDPANPDVTDPRTATWMEYELTFPPFQLLVPAVNNRGRALYSSVRGTWPDGAAKRGLFTFLYTGGSPNFILAYNATRVRSLVPTASGIKGDLRLVATSSNPGALFTKVQGYDEVTQFKAHSLKDTSVTYDGTTLGALVAGIPSTVYNVNPRPDIPAGVNGATNSLGEQGDWDNGVGIMPDGPWINKADEGSSMVTVRDFPPYIGSVYSQVDSAPAEATIFSPNRQMPSPVMFGSLPTGVKRGLPWQTLLFRPARAYLPGGINHPGASAAGHPPDHLLLDLFWSPVVEPYAISEPFSTAGKINLNYQIAPFHFIHRDTALRAVFAATKVTAIPHNHPQPPRESGETNPMVARYKNSNFRDSLGVGSAGIPFREAIDNRATLAFFNERFTQNRPFISASEICEIPLVPRIAVTPADDTMDKIENALTVFWEKRLLTGDNSLERPYAHIYPRVTTKSNTFTVHVRVQALQKNLKATANIFQSGVDVVAGEFRGSFLIERYLDPNAQSFDITDPNAVLGPYKIRTINSKQFSL